MGFIFLKLGIIKVSETRISTIHLHDFVKLFSGNRRAYGRHIPKYEGNGTEGLKKKGESFFEKSLLTEEQYLQHLSGNISIGVIPIDDENRCIFSAIDVDDYVSNHEEFVKSIYENKIPLMPFKSKSGGLHLYLFFEERVKASFVIQQLKRFLAVLGLPSDTEIFPKQTMIKKDSFGSFLNLPYFNCVEPDRYLYDKDFKPVPIQVALDEIMRNRVRKDGFDEIFGRIPLSDGPPCLQSIFLRKTTNSRNKYLFSLARYYKSKYGDDYKFKVLEANERLDRPLEVSEIDKTIFKSHDKKDYSYTCTQDPLCSLCDKIECRKRQYGIGGSHVSELDYGDFLQYRTDPPYYEWIINEKSLMFYNESDIINQKRFQELCFRELHIFPATLKMILWNDIVNRALQNVIVKEVAPEDEISSRSLFMDLLVEFFEDSRIAKSRDQILAGRVFKDDEKQSYVFIRKYLQTYLVFIKQFKQFKTTELTARLKKMGAQSKDYYHKELPKGRVKAWFLPYEALTDYVRKDHDADITFNVEETYEDKPY